MTTFIIVFCYSRALFPCGDHMVCIIDDREDVWNFAPNVIAVKPYHFFQHTGDINAPPGLDKHDQDGSGCMPECIRRILKQNRMLTKAIFTALLEKQKDNKSSPILAADEQKNIPDEKPEKPAEIEPTECKSADTNAKEVPPKPDEDNPEMQEIIPSKDLDSENQAAIPKKVQDDSDGAGEKKSEEANHVGKKDEQIDEMEIEDPDDYLMYLEEILSKIHSEYYKQYDETGAVPVMRDVIPSIRRKILEGQCIVFSGVVPTHVSVNNSRYAQMARKLGATVAEQVSISNILSLHLVNFMKKFKIVPGETTHLVAARHGTAKVNEARRAGTGVLVVSPDWLVCCTERWERADERLFPLSKSSKRGLSKLPFV